MNDENYKKVLEECANIIKQDYAPCGLEADVKKRLLDLTQEWERRKENANKDGRRIGELETIFIDLFRAVNQAESNAKRFEKSKCEYLRNGLRTPFSKSGGLGFWTLRMMM